MAISSEVCPYGRKFHGQPIIDRVEMVFPEGKLSGSGAAIPYACYLKNIT
jgi:hypothetical protein